MSSIRSSSATLLVLTLGLLLLCALAWWSISGDEGGGRGLELDVDPGVDGVDAPNVVREPVEKDEAVASGESAHTAELDGGRSSRPTAEASSSRVSEGAVAEEDPGPPPNPHPPWFLETTIAPAGMTFNDGFPWSLALDEETLIAGAPRFGGPGEVLVFVREGDEWREQAKLRGEESGERDLLGAAVAISGDTLVAGAPGSGAHHGTFWVSAGDESPRVARLGTVYVFTRKGDEWTREARLTSGLTDRQDQFGAAVCISGDTVLVGAGKEGYYGKTSGLLGVHVFVRDGPEWKKQAELLSSDADWDTGFGASVALVGERAVIGAQCQRGTGLAYVFEREGTSWRELCRLGAQGPWSHWGVGWSVAMYEEEIAVSVQHPDVECRVLLYQVDREACLNVDQLFPPLDLPPEAAENPAVAMHGQTLLVSWNDWAHQDRCVEVYARENLVWKLQSTLAAPGDHQWQFGHPVALSKDWLAIGNPSYKLVPDERSGAVHLYRRED